MLLAHRRLCAVERVADHAAEEGEADLAGDPEVLLPVIVDHDHVVPILAGSHIDVLAQLDVPLGPDQEEAAVPPGSQPIGSEPIEAEVTGDSGIGGQAGIAVILQPRILWVMEVGDPARHHRCVRGAAEVEHLLDLVGADVRDDAAVPLAVEEPSGTISCLEAVRPPTTEGDELADGSILEQLLGIDRRFDMNALTVIDEPLETGLLDLGPGRLHLLSCGERRLIGEVILTGIEGLEAERAALIGDGGTGDEVNRRIGEDLLLALCNRCRGEGLNERLRLRRVLVKDAHDHRPRLGEAVAHTVDMAVIQADDTDEEFSLLADRGRLALRCVVLSIHCAHRSPPPYIVPRVISESSRFSTDLSFL